MWADPHAAVVVGVEIPHNCYRVGRKAQVCHVAEEEVMVYGVEGVREVDIQGEEVGGTSTGVTYGRDQSVELSGRRPATLEALLEGGNDGVVMGELREYICQETRPEFEERAAQSNRPIVGEEGGVIPEFIMPGTAGILGIELIPGFIPGSTFAAFIEPAAGTVAFTSSSGRFITGAPVGFCN